MKTSFLNKRIAYHFYFWGVVLLVFFLLLNVERSAGDSFTLASLYSVLLAVPVYLHFLALEFFFNRKKYIFYILSAVGVLVFSGYFNRYLISMLLDDKNILMAYHVHVLIFIIFTTALKFLKSDFKQRLQRHENETRQLEDELKQLKSSISADFMLNELSRLHILSKDKSAKVPGLILNHSESMRRLLKKPDPRPVPPGEKKEDTPKIPGIFNSRLAWYIYAWGVLFFLIFFPWGAADTFTMGRFNFFCYFFLLTLPTYPHLFLLDRFFHKKRPLYLLLTTGTIVLGSMVNFYVSSHFLGNKEPVFQWMLELTFAVLITTAVKIVKDGFKQRVQLQEIKGRHLQSELSLLKSQVNPHFFFNTLNNLYSLSLDGSEKLPGLIQKLRDLMAYMLESSTGETVPLNEEWTFLENYLSLEKLRLSEESEIKTSVTGDLKGKRIAPMLLIPFVENSFKHGVSAAARDVFVFIRLNVETRRLFFSVVNNRPRVPDPSRAFSPKTGLKNVKRRLDLLYPNTHNLNIFETGETFNIELEVWL